MELIHESPWAGIGRGAFEPVFTRVHPASAFATFSHVENEYVQAVVDWGVPGTIALAGILAVVPPVRDTAMARWTTRRRCARRARRGLAPEQLSISVSSSSALPCRRRDRRDAGIRAHGRGRSIPQAAHGDRDAGGSRPCSRGGRRAPARNRDAFRHEDRAALARISSLEALRTYVERHPLDYYGYALASKVMSWRGDKRAVRILEPCASAAPDPRGLASPCRGPVVHGRSCRTGDHRVRRRAARERIAGSLDCGSFRRFRASSPRPPSPSIPRSSTKSCVRCTTWSGRMSRRSG